MAFDLSQLESVRTFAAQLGDYISGSIDTLVLCAGVIPGKRRITQDGFEETMQVNALSEALLLDLLWPKLIAPGKKSRILFISSALHLRAVKGVERDCVELTWLMNGAGKRLTPTTFDAYPSIKHYRPMSAYADSKLLLMHVFFLTYTRSQSGSGPHSTVPEVLSLSPGFVPLTGLVRESGPVARWASKWILPYLCFAKTPQQSGAFIAQLITGTPLPADPSTPDQRKLLVPKSGAYVSISKGEVRAAEECYDEEVREAWSKVLQDRGLWHPSGL